MHDLRTVTRESRARLIASSEHRSFSSTSKLAAIPKDPRYDVPLRAQSVSLAERPRSKYARNVRSADQNRSRSRYADKQFVHRPQSKTKTPVKQSSVPVKLQNRKVVEKIPCAVSVQNLSIPMKYADELKRHSTSKSANQNKTKTRNPPKQVSDKRLCHTVGGKETENKLLVQISEAEQVSDFERILNSNAILCERAHGHVWKRRLANAPSAAVVPRPRSSYSLYTVSQAYHYLFRQHEESLQPLIDQYRQDNAENKTEVPDSLLGKNWYENLQDLSEFYEDDQALKKEIETITDRIVSDEVKADDRKNKNFNVNLTDLIGLRVSGDGFSPVLSRDEFGPSPDVDKLEGDDEKEWLYPIMNANSDDSGQDNPNVDCLAQNLNSVKIDSDAKVPTITFSNCSDGCAKSDSPNNSDVVIHLTVPSVDSIDETRPPMM